MTGTDLATDVSRRTDRTSYSIPEDGSPVTINTKKRKEKRDREQEGTLTKTSHQSQTSLLIEYYEGGKGSNVHSRPSVRVKVTPSGARKIKDTNEHIQITTAGSSRKPSYTRRISLGPRNTADRQIAESADDRSISSYTSAAEESSLAGRYPPVEIEVMHRDQGSDLSVASASRQRYIQQNPSEFSSIPTDSMLEENTGSVTPRLQRSRSFSKGAVSGTHDTLKTPSRRRSRSLSKERLAHQVMEKLEGKSRDASSGKRRHGSKHRSRSVSNEQIVGTTKSPKRRSSRHHQDEEVVSGVDSSLLSHSQLSPRRTSGDQYSFRSGTSKSSINNPKLIETVEEAIRRLILPEISTLKQEQKMQQNRHEFEWNNRMSIASGDGSGELIRRVSKHASAPDVSLRPKVVLNRDENNPGMVLSGNSVKGRKESRDNRNVESPSGRFERDMSEETVIHNEESSRKKSWDGHRWRDAAAGGFAGAVLTSAALEHHDSRSSVDKRERKRRRSKSHSRTASFAGSTEEIFNRHDVPPMPLRSEIYSSEVTRDSILSERTEEIGSPSERRRAEIRQVSRGSPLEVQSPASRTPNRTPISLRKSLGTHHSNLSREDLSIHSAHSDKSLHDENRRSMAAEVEYAGAATGAEVQTADLPEHDDINEHDEHAYTSRARNRGLSPIQSVASFKEENDLPNRDSLRQTRSSGSISSIDQRHGKASQMSINSLSSAASTKIARSNRPRGINLENEQDVLDQHALRDSDPVEGDYSAKDPAMDEWYERQHEQNDRYRESYGSSDFRDSTVDVKHLTNFTDESLDAPYLDKVTAAQQIQGIGANPEYIHTPVAVESAVASLLDPSVLSERSKVESKAYVESLEHYSKGGKSDDVEGSRDLGAENGGGEGHQGQLTQSLERLNEYKQHSEANSPRQSVARSLDDREESVHLGASGVPDLHDPMPAIGHGLDSEESDLTTNPSIIKGPIGGVHHDSRDHWPYQPTPPQSKNDFVSHSNEQSTHDSLKAAADGMLSAAALAQREKEWRESGKQSRERSIKDHVHSAADEHNSVNNHDLGPIPNTYMSNQPIPTPPMTKDEGYISARLSPEPKRNARGFSRGMTNIDDLMADDDPFVSDPRSRHLSANSHGMPSPLFDSATGQGIDRIQSKDIVALMDHVSRRDSSGSNNILTKVQLTVRDAQRNARDTEILVTLVRSAAEMRNSFEDMKRFIADQDEMLIDTGNKQHDRTIQKVIGGPRPQPLGTPRATRRASAEEEHMDDLPTKRRSVFKRALKGLSGRNSNDYGKIEEMFFQLLGEMEGLKAAHDIRPSANGTRPGSLNSYDNLRAAGPDGYEPEGQAGTSSSNGNHSGYFSNPPSRQASGMRGNEARRGSQNRISTVLEGDEELENREPVVLDHQIENNENLLTPTRDFPRGGSVPIDTPPQVHIPTGAQSNEHTPKTGTDKSRKHKSSNSSFFPKISRWSKTTASSVADNVKGTARRGERPISSASRSGSEGHYNANDHYDLHGDDRLRSNESLDDDTVGQENRPPSPLIPSQVSERPKYQAQRDSLNLQHPQPRLGPTQRYHTQLESQAHNFGSPISPTSDQWGSNPSLARFAPGPGNRHSGGAGNLSPISDAGYSEISAADQTAASTRPPKVRDDGPLVPARLAKSSAKDNKPTFASPLSSEHLAPEQRYSNGSAVYEQVR